MSSRRFFFAAKIALASSVADGAMTTSVKILVISSAAAASIGRLSATMPPNALVGIAAQRFPIGLGQRLPMATPHGLACLMMATAARRLRIELGHQLEGCVRIVQVVVG